MKQRTFSAASDARHGMSRTPEYFAWHQMIARCFHAGTKQYPKYGGIGITVCPQWRNSFVQFFTDVGPRPSENHIFYRYDICGNYEPGNCGWITHAEASSKRVNNLFGEFRGETCTLSELQRKSGIGMNTLRGRILNHGMSFDEAVDMGDGYQRVAYQGSSRTIAEWAMIKNIPADVLRRRINTDLWPIDRALETPYRERK